VSHLVVSAQQAAESGVATTAVLSVAGASAVSADPPQDVRTKVTANNAIAIFFIVFVFLLFLVIVSRYIYYSNSHLF
jgi:hypothetical protein